MTSYNVGLSPNCSYYNQGSSNDNVDIVFELKSLGNPPIKNDEF